MVDLTPLIGTILTLISAIITTFLVPWLRSKLNINEQQLNAMFDSDFEYWVTVADGAAEQIFSQKPKSGSEKKAYVINWLNEHGYDVDQDELEVQIEYAVYKIKNGILSSATTTETI